MGAVDSSAFAYNLMSSLLLASRLCRVVACFSSFFSMRVTAVAGRHTGLFYVLHDAPDIIS